MIVGNLYRLTEQAKASIIKYNDLYKWKRADGIGCFLFSKPSERKLYPLDTLVVPLEVHTVTVDGKPLAGDKSRRLVALLSTGDMGTMWVDINDWEEAIE